LQGAQPDVLSNPESWRAAYFHARGAASAPQRQQQQQQGQQPQQHQGGPPAPAGFQPNWPPQQQPQQHPQQFFQVQPQQQFFVEGPTPSAPAGGPGQQGNDPRDEVMARRFNMPVEVYRAWKPPVQGTQYQQLGPLPRPSNGVPPQNPFGWPVQPQQQQQPQQFAPPGQGQYPPQSPPGYYQPSLQNGLGYGGF
jgi:hypothetical protein